jgi:hypothetical protein
LKTSWASGVGKSGWIARLTTDAKLVEDWLTNFGSRTCQERIRIPFAQITVCAAYACGSVASWLTECAFYTFNRISLWVTCVTYSLGASSIEEANVLATSRATMEFSRTAVLAVVIKAA